MSEPIILSERSRFGHETGAGILRNRCAFTSRDMGNDWPEAFTYAIVMGWDDPDVHEEGAMQEMARRYDWDDELIAFLRDAHERFEALSDRTPSGDGRG